MNQVTLHFVNGSNMIDFYISKDPANTAKNLMVLGLYEAKVINCDVDGDIEDIADEMFDLTNNPSRQSERVAKYGRGRSLSVGDMVEVNGKKIVCASVGWVAVDA